jgi:predicted dehydrogenase
MGQRYRKVLQTLYTSDISFTTVDPKAAGVAGDQHFESLSQVPRDLKFDLAIDAKPNSERVETFKDFLTREISYIVIEKPPAASMKELSEIQDVLAAAPYKPHVMLPFYQRYAEEFSHETLAKLDAGPLRSIVAAGGAIGLGCNGIHTLDLVSFIYKTLPLEVTAHLVLNSIASPRGENFRDHGGTIHLKYPNGTLILQIIPDSMSGTQMTLFYDRGKIVILEQDGSWQWYRQPKESWTQPYYRTHGDTPTPAPFPFNIQIEEIMQKALQKFLHDGNTPNLSDGYHAMKTIALAIASHSHKRTVGWGEDSLIEHIEFPFT